MADANERPLFIPLRAEFFNAFASGRKDTEYREYGPRWNERTCRIGRAVIISCGYGKRARITGKVISFKIRRDTRNIPGWWQCYGGSSADAACIRIKLDPR